MNEKDLDRVTGEIICVLKGEDFEVSMNALGSAIVSIAWKLFGEESKNVLQEFCNNMVKCIDSIQDGSAEIYTVTSKK